MKKFLIALGCALVLFIIGLIVDNALIASCCVVPIIVLLLSYLKKAQNKSQKNGGTNIPPLSKEPPLPKPRKELHHTFISGIKYYQADELIEDIDFDEFEINDDFFMSRKELIEDDNYDRIWKYEQIDLDAYLEAEPTNEHDPNALKVIAQYDDKSFMLGYVPKEKQEDVKEAERYFVAVNGGEYKQLNDDDELIKGKTDYSFNLEWIK